MEEQTKRTDKYKRKSLGGFYSEFSRFDVRGKSSKDLKLMVEDLKNAVTHQLVRINKLKYVIICLRKLDKTKQLANQKNRTLTKIKEKNVLNRKLGRREEKIEDLETELITLEQQIKQQDKEIAKLNREVDKKEEKIAEVRTRKARGWTKTVKIPLSDEAKRIERIASNGASKQAIQNLEYVSRTANFLKERQLPLNLLEVITRTETLGNVKTKDVGVTYRILNKLVEQGYLNASNELKGSSKYWYISLKGKELIKDYRNYLSYSRKNIKL